MVIPCDTGSTILILFTLLGPPTKGIPSKCYRSHVTSSKISFVMFWWPAPSCLNKRDKPLRPIPNQSQLHSPSICPELTHHPHDQCCSHCCALQCSWGHPHHCHVLLVAFWADLYHFEVCCAHCWLQLQQFWQGPLPVLIFRCTVWGAIPLCELGIDEGPDKWTSHWGCNSIGNIWQGKDGG